MVKRTLQLIATLYQIWLPVWIYIPLEHLEQTRSSVCGFSSCGGFFSTDFAENRSTRTGEGGHLPSYNNGQSTYPHVGYPHEKQSLNKLVLTNSCSLNKALLNPYFSWGYLTVHGGRLTGHDILNKIITPFIGVISPQLSIYFRPFIGVISLHL